MNEIIYSNTEDARRVCSKHTEILRECRRLIHDDRDAGDIATALYEHEDAFENVRQYVYNYLVECWKATPGWDDPAFIKIVKAVLKPLDTKIAGFAAAEIAYTELEPTQQDVLKLKVVEGLSDEGIVQITATPLEQIKRDAASAKETFWKLLTLQRWSVLPYFIEALSEESDSPSAKILKVAAEYNAAKEAYDSLDEMDKAVLIKRCVHGLSLEEIATQENTGPDEVAEDLMDARDKFYNEFSTAMYLLYVRDRSTCPRVGATQPLNHNEEDDLSDAWAKFSEERYKFVPENLSGWLRTSAKRLKLGRLNRDETLNRIAEKDRDLDRDTERDSDNGKPIRLASSVAESRDPHDELMKGEAEEREAMYWAVELERWHRLFRNTAHAILETKKPEKKLFLLANYFLQPKLGELRAVNRRGTSRFQDPSEVMMLDHAKSLYPSRVTQQWIGEPIDETDRTIRRYADEIVPLVKRHAEELGISREALIEGCAPIKKWEDAEKE